MSEILRQDAKCITHCKIPVMILGPWGKSRNILLSRTADIQCTKGVGVLGLFFSGGGG